MGKWRPVDNCLYVIPDIHGMAGELELILNRILPLRRTGGQWDSLVFLGDYIDRKIESYQVIDMLIDVKKNFPDQTFYLFGNHELMFLSALSPDSLHNEYSVWMSNGGEETVIGYLQRSKSDIENPYLIDRHQLSRFIPKEHINFLNSLLPYYETDDYIFVHGGCDPFKPLNEQMVFTLAWDRSVYAYVRKLAQNKLPCPWNKTIVTGHNGDKGVKAFKHDKFMMLDGSFDEKVYVWELNSRTGFSARKKKKRLVGESIT